MRIRLDVDSCTGHGICEALAEDIFDVNGYVDLSDTTRGEDRREAFTQCPARPYV